jgi:hypothetical protein
LERIALLFSQFELSFQHTVAHAVDVCRVTNPRGSLQQVCHGNDRQHKSKQTRAAFPVAGQDTVLPGL